VVVKIEGLTPAQEIALNDFFAKLKGCIDNDASRWIAIFADGADTWKGVSFLIDDNEPVNCGIPPNAQRWWNMYFKDNEGNYSPEPFYMAESYTIEQALSEGVKNEDNPEKTD